MPVVKVCDECGAKAGTCNCYDWGPEKAVKCSSCDDEFVWDDKVVIVDDKFYHKDCLELYPTGNEDGQMACEIIDGLLDDE